MDVRGINLPYLIEDNQSFSHAGKIQTVYKYIQKVYL